MPPSTPPRPTEAPDPYHTAMTVNNSLPQANLEQQRSKKAKMSTHPPPKNVTAGKGHTASDTEPTLQGIITSQYAKLEREARIRKEVITRLAATLDEFVASFNGPTQTDHRREARDFARTLGQHLNTAVFAQSGGEIIAPIRPASTPARTDTSAEPETAITTTQSLSDAPSAPSWAGTAKSGANSPIYNISATKGPLTSKAKATAAPRQQHKPEDTRVLVRVRPDRLAARPPPYAARIALLQRLRLSETAIKDIQPTNTGWAIKTADLVTRDKLLEEANMTTKA